ncbi:MAG TPA: ATP synthase F0 subunit B [Blastocatellia bacterium]|nr:ATP synthase F0 subunit B [Blastocatellia bacterium]
MLAHGVLAFAEGGSSIINPDGSLVFILLLFLLFVFVMNRLLFRPVSRILDQRQTLTAGAANDARAAARRYEMKLSEYEATIRQARAESYKNLEAQRAVALAERQQVVEAAKQATAEEIGRAKAEIQRQSEQARMTLETESRQIAENISRTILGRTVGGGAD